MVINMEVKCCFMILFLVLSASATNTHQHDYTTKAPMTSTSTLTKAPMTSTATLTKAPTTSTTTPSKTPTTSTEDPTTNAPTTTTTTTTTTTAGHQASTPPSTPPSPSSTPASTPQSTLASTPALTTPQSSKGDRYGGTSESTTDNDVNSKVTHIQDVVNSLSRQIIDLQTFVEERIRSEGQSGVKVARHVHEGTREYYSDTHVSASAASMHDHADYQSVLGLGEFVAVLNGIEFRTRHNDYLFKQPVQGREFNAAEFIPFPDVPPEVNSQSTIEEQASEMREWFKAFKNQDHSVRDYRKYFKANLCYLEGGWTLSSRDKLEEPFKSDRHSIDATSWFDLAEKIRFTSYAGHQDQLENFAYLPTTMYNISEDGTPQIAQWNYRIMCHPLKDDLPTRHFKLQDDLTVRMSRKTSMEKIKDLRVARFKLNEFGVDKKTRWTLLDKLMSQVPGKDNYGANLVDDAFGLMNFDISRLDQKPINVGFYHRWFKVGYRGAMGNAINHRGFNDENLWISRTTQPKIMPLTIPQCNGLKQCHWMTRRVTYAIPLEIVYTSPLNSWNPYNLTSGSPKDAEGKGRYGGFTFQEAFNGTSFRHNYKLPIEFYRNCSKSSTPRPDVMGMLDPQGKVRKVATSGFTIVTPDIEGVGKVRMRYPIFPVHSEGSTVGKELMALKDMVMKMDRYRHLYEEPPYAGNNDDFN